MFSRFRKTNYWLQIGEIEGFHEAIEALGSNWKLLDEGKHGYTDDNTIWGQLAANTKLQNKHTCEARKWLYTTWNRNRDGVRTKFYAKMGFDQPPAREIETHDNAKNQNKPSNSKVYE